MTRTRTDRSILYRSIAFGLVAVLALPSAGAAQDDGADEKEKEEQVVVVNVHSEVETKTWKETGTEAAAWSGAGSKQNFAVLEDALGMLMAEFGGDPLIGALGASASGSLTDLKKELNEGGGPKKETTDYVIYIRPEEFRLKAQGFTMLWRAGEMSYTNPQTGTLTPIDLNLVNSGVVGDAIQHTGMEPTPSPGAETKGVAGHLTRRYEYSYTMEVLRSLPAAMGLGTMGEAAAEVEVVGEAWIARGLPEAEQVATFYRNFAGAFGDQQSMMGGQTAGMAKLAEIGVPLETKETSTVYMKAAEENGDLVRFPVQHTVSTTTVTSISTVPLSELEEEAEAEAEPPPDDLEEPQAQTQVPGGQPPEEPPPCDCSCTAFKELQDLDEDDPDIMAKAMCAQKCMAKWVGCAAP